MANTVRDIPGAYLTASHGWEREAIEIVTERIADEARILAPVADPARIRAPGEGVSWPPGALKASIDTEYGEDGEGLHGDVRALYVARFRAKKRHAVPDFLTPALERQAGRAVP